MTRGSRGKHSFARANIARCLSSVGAGVVVDTCGPFSLSSAPKGPTAASRRKEKTDGPRGWGKKKNTRIERNKNITFRDGGAKGARGTSGSSSGIPSALYSSSDRMFVFRKMDRNETRAAVNTAEPLVRIDRAETSRAFYIFPPLLPFFFRRERHALSRLLLFQPVGALFFNTFLVRIGPSDGRDSLRVIDRELSIPPADRNFGPRVSIYPNPFTFAKWQHRNLRLVVPFAKAGSYNFKNTLRLQPPPFARHIHRGREI